MTDHKLYGAHQLNNLEDKVCRAFHFASMAKMVVEYIISLDERVEKMPLTRADREALWFAAAEAEEAAQAAKAEFYAL